MTYTPQVTDDGLQEKGEKFIKDGQLYIRRGGRIYNILDWKSLVDTNDDLSYNVLIKSYDNCIIRAG